MISDMSRVPVVALFDTTDTTDIKKGDVTTSSIQSAQWSATVSYPLVIQTVFIHVTSV